jgi:hypothetical protein
VDIKEGGRLLQSINFNRVRSKTTINSLSIFTVHFILQSSLLSAVLLGIANAVALDLQKRDSPLEVTLAPSGNAVVKV